MPRRTPNDYADLVIYKDDECKDPYFIFEAMRNCVAHNRRPSRRVVENYGSARPLLNQLLDNYLSQWLCYEEIESESLESEPKKATNH